MNLSHLSRREQVLARLVENKDHWVDGTDLATAECGGSEGLKRLRELRAEGHLILARRHPSPDRDIYQYMLVDAPPVPATRKPDIAPEPVRVAPMPKEPFFDMFTKAPRNFDFGMVGVCPRCHAKTKKDVNMDNESVFRDPDRTKLACMRCNGYGVIKLRPVPQPAVAL